MSSVNKFVRNQTNIYYLLFLLISFNALADRQVYTYPPGIHKVDEIVLDKPHALLQGAGRGVTILIVKDGVLANAPEPVIRDLTIIGEGKGVGLTLRNTWSAQVQNLEIEKFHTGLLIEMTPEGARLAGGKTIKGWPGALTEGDHWGSRVTLTEIREVEIMDIHDGIVMRNLLPQGNRGRDGSFFTATTIWGGHIYAKRGNGISIGDNVWNTKIIGTFIDIWSGSGIYMSKDAWKLTLIGISLDLSKKKKHKTGGSKISVESQRAAKSIEIYASRVNNSDIEIVKWKK